MCPEDPSNRKFASWDRISTSSNAVRMSTSMRSTPSSTALLSESALLWEETRPPRVANDLDSAPDRSSDLRVSGGPLVETGQNRQIAGAEQIRCEDVAEPVVSEVHPAGSDERDNRGQ